MSMESHVLFRGPLPAKAAVNAVLRELALPFSISGRGKLEGHHGFMPMKLRRAETGVEFDVFDDAELLAQFAGQIDPAFDRTASLRWGGDEDQMLAGLCVAAALARLLNASVFDEAEDALLDADGAVAVARKNLQAVADSIEAEKARGRTRGTRPADIRHYLKPLLKMRPDLLLRGRMLVVRPVRHILRGAYLDRSSDRFSFNIQRYLIPLYGPANSLGGADQLSGNWHVWEPDFQAQLIDKLADAMFAPFGKVSTLADFAETMIAFARKEGTHMQFEAPVTAFILAGEPDRAAAYLDDLERRYADHRHMLHFARQMRAELDRDVSELCAEHHAKEAATAAALELEDDWEPTPFPVEVPKASRVARCADGVFTPAPWMVPPDGLFQDLPEQLGEVCFAIDWTRRQGRQMLVHPLTRAQAQDKHQRGESYYLAVRLPLGDVSVFVHYWGLNPADPDPHLNRDRASYSWIRLSVLTPTGYLGTDFHVDWDHPDRLSALSAHVDSPISRDTIWRSFLNAREGRRSEHDFRREPGYASYDMTEAEMAPHLTFTAVFGDAHGLLRRAADFIRMTAYGHLLEEVGLHV